MMRLLARLLVALVGLASLLGTFQHWLMLGTVANTRGFAAVDAMGRANLRADVGGIFLAIGLFALIAAWQQSARWALTAMLVVCCTLSGRFVSIALDGIGQQHGDLLPFFVEGTTLAILGFGWSMWRKRVPAGL